MDFEKIYETHFSDVYLYIRRLSGDEQVAEEITSETFFKALRSIDSFRGDCDLRVWLCQIAKNCFYDYKKKKARFSNIEDAELEDTIDPESFIDEIIANQEQARQIQKHLHTLPEPYKEVFMWRVFAELSFKQIGQLFGKTDNWACVTYHRARTMLKSRLEEGSCEK